MKNDEGSPVERKVDEDGLMEGDASRRHKDSRKQEVDMNYEGKRPIPIENQEDMRPFPTNTLFKSEAVLSEELKDEIYKRVVVDKVSVRRVSADLHVEMRRVGAVVRLKVVEKAWEEKVRPRSLNSHGMR